MRVMVFFNNESGDEMEPTPEMKEAFAPGKLDHALVEADAPSQLA